MIRKSFDMLPFSGHVRIFSLIYAMEDDARIVGAVSEAAGTQKILAIKVGCIAMK